MTTQHFTLFDTAIGICGVVWTARGIAGVQLPEGSASATRKRVCRRFPDAIEVPPPPDVQRAVHGMVALLAGERRDLTDVAIDDEGIPEFNRRVYAIVRTIPPGATMTYGEIAKRLGDPLLARDIGRAMGENPTPIVMPCHRVLAAGGRTGGFSAAGGVAAKLQLLTIENAQPNGPMLFDRLPLATGPRHRA